MYQRVKQHKDLNYVGVFNNGKTIRLTPNPSKPISPLPFPELEDVSFTSKCLAGCSYCFVPGTQITLEDGSTNGIEDIVIGDLVQAGDKVRKATQLHVRTVMEWLYVITVNSNTTITCTGNHKIVTENGDVEARSLTLDTLVVTGNGLFPITSISRHWYIGEVYNLGVEEIHYYWANNIKVSNCYTSALKTGTNHDNIVEKILDYYGSLEENDRPFQVAIGGQGEPTMHPDFCKALEAFSSLNIMPNYTTNGMHLTEEIIDATKKYSGGVAVSCHPHLEKVWRRAVKTYVGTGIKTCVHIIVGEPGTAQKFWEIYDSLEGIHYYVALPYMAAGRAKEIEVEAEWLMFFEELIKRGVTNIAFGALFYPFFQKHPHLVHLANIELYEPEVLSGYRILDDNYKTLLKSSYDLVPKIRESNI